jgi:hypothetical protein
MAFVLTVDQRGSRRTADRVPHALRRLERIRTLRPFERTAGDEFQGVLDDPLSVVDAILDLVRDGSWSIGVGVGAVDRPLPEQTRAGRGEAFALARDAVERAKRDPQHLAVGATNPENGRQAQAVLRLLAVVVQRRSEAAWKAAELAAEGLTLTEAGRRLGISRQAVGQRLTAGLWHQEQQARPAAAGLLARAEKATA